MSFQMGDKVRIINPNNPDFGLEGVVEGIEGSTKCQWKYQVMKRESACVFKYRWVFDYEIELIKEPTIKLGKNLLDGITINKDGIKAEGLWEFNNNNAILQPYTEIGCDEVVSLRYCLENKKGEKDNMKLLDLYETKMAEKIKAECEEKCKEIKAQDDFTILRRAYEEDVKDLYEAEFEKEFDYEIEFEMTFETKETKEKMMEAEHEMAKKLRELRSTVEEIEAHLGIIPEGEYETVIKLLKKYGILNKEGKLNV